MVYLLVLLLTIFGFTIRPAWSQPGEEHGFPFITRIAPDEYDGHIQNWNFAADSNGVLYVANLAAVLRYDGVNWSTVDIPNARVLSIANDDDGRIYVGGVGEFGYLEAKKTTSGAGEEDATVTPIREEAFSPVEYRSLKPLLPDTLELDDVWSIRVSGNDVLYHTLDYLFRYDGDEVTVYSTDTRFTTIFTRDDEFYVRESHHGVRKLGSDSLHIWEYGHLFEEETLQGYLKIGDTEIFCSFYECFYLGEDALTPMQSDADDYLRNNYIDGVQALSDQTIAIATRNGGIVQLTVDGDLIRIIDEASGLINNAVYGMYEDERGMLWAATVNGLSRIEVGLPLRRYDHRHGLTESSRRMTIFDGDLFLSSTAGVYRMSNDGQAHLYDGKTSCGDFLKHRGTLFVSCLGAMYRYTGDGFDQLTSNHVSEVATLFDGEILVAADESGVLFFSFDDAFEKQVHYEIEDVAYSPNSIYTDDLMNIWIGSDARGVYRVEPDYDEDGFHGHTVSRYLEELENPSGDTRVYVTELGGSAAFLTWGKGIQRFDHETGSMVDETRYGPEFSDPNEQVFRASEDHNGNVWFRSGQRYKVAFRGAEGQYTSGDPILNRIDDRQSNAIYPDMDGHVWFLTERGVIRYDPQREFDENADFFTSICDVYVRADSLIAFGSNDNPVTLDYQDNELRFTYSAAMYDAPEYTVYRVKLEGFDHDWSAWTSEPRKDYTNIPEGQYRFLVEARNVYGTVSRAAPFHLQINPPWYRTFWAYLIYLTTTIGVLYTAYRIRLNQILREQRIRNNIAGDLHDEISATLSSISFFAQAIESRKTTGDKSRFVRLIADSAGEAKEKISDIVWAINPEHDDWKSFLSRCRRYASDLLESRKITYTLNIDEHIPGKMDMRLRQHLWLIFKEMIMNVVRHAGATHVHIVIRYTGGMVTAIVQDDGKGMDPAVKNEGNGLHNIRRRAEQIRGEAVLETEPDMGTRWKVTVRI